MSVLSRASVALAVGALAAAACINPAPAQTHVVKVTGPTINDTTHNWMKIFKGRLDKAGGDRMRADLYPASQLGPIPRMIEGVQLGTIEIAVMPIDFLAGVDKRYTLVGAPAVFDDVTHGFRALHDPKAKELFWQLGDAKNFTTIGMTCDTPTTYVAKRPIKTLHDFQGKKVRVFANVAERETLRRLGATASPMPIEEVMMSLTTGVIDAAKGTVTVWYPFKYYGVAKHIVRTNEALICVIKIASKKWLEGLPADLRQALLAASIESDRENMPFIVEFIQQSYQQWTAAGGEIFDLTPGEQSELRQKLATVGDFVVENDPDLKPAYTVFKEVAARTRR